MEGCKSGRSPVKCLHKLDANCDGAAPGGMVSQANDRSGEEGKKREKKIYFASIITLGAPGVL